MIIRWATAAPAVPHSKEVDQIVVEMLLKLGNFGRLRSYIPTEMWAGLKEQSSLPPLSEARHEGTRRNLVRHVQGLGDPDILKSYFLLVWSEWDVLYDSGFAEMQASIVEDLGGIGMQHYPGDLIRHLDYVLG